MMEVCLARGEGIVPAYSVGDHRNNRR